MGPSTQHHFVGCAFAKRIFLRSCDLGLSTGVMCVVDLNGIGLEMMKKTTPELLGIRGVFWFF